MKKVIAAFVAGIVLATASVAGAMNVIYQGNGIACAKQGRSVACIKTDGGSPSGYGVAINRDAVMVMRVSDEHVVYKHYQP